jgi:hypothetical protein
MAEKLKSILKRIHWSLPRKSLQGVILKAAVFAVAWLVVPWWLFLLIALYCYFIPFFRPGKTAILFFCLLALTIVQRPSFLFALVFGVIFYCILLIKDLLIINRRSAYEILVLSLSFFLIRIFFAVESGINVSTLFWAFWCAVAIGLLTHSMMRFFSVDVPKKRALLSMFSWLIILLSWQCILVGLFLPLNFVYQSIIVFVSVTFFCELIAGYFGNSLSRVRIFVTAGVFFALLVLLFTSATWK